MRSAPFLLLTLAACGQQPQSPENLIRGKEDEAAAGVAFPERFRGEWQEASADCGRGADGGTVISADRIAYSKTDARLLEVSPVDERTIDFVARVRDPELGDRDLRESLTLLDDDRLQIEAGGGGENGPSTLVRCGR